MENTSAIKQTDSTADLVVSLGPAERARVAKIANRLKLSPERVLRGVLRNVLGFRYVPGGLNCQLANACNEL